MKDVLGVHVCEAADNFLDDGPALIEGKDSMLFFGQNLCEVSDVTIFSDHENPIAVLIREVLPSKES